MDKEAPGVGMILVNTLSALLVQKIIVCDPAGARSSSPSLRLGLAGGVKSNQAIVAAIPLAFWLAHSSLVMVGFKSKYVC